MDLSKHNRNISLLCPVCRGKTVEQSHSVGMKSCKCDSCDREFTQEELMRANRRNINKNISGIQKAVAADAQKKVNAMLKKAFK